MASVQRVHSHAAQQVREKKAQHQSNQTPQPATASPSVLSVPPPAFDQPKPKQNKQRKRASQPTSSATPAPSALQAPPQLNQIPLQATASPTMPPPAFDRPMPKSKQNKQQKEASQPTSSATPAPSAPPQLSPIRTTPVPWSYRPQSLAAPPGGSAGPSFTSNGAAAMPPTYAPWNQGSKTHPHQVMQRYEPYQRAHINQPPTYLQHAPQQRHDHTHQPWNYHLPTTTAAESQLSHDYSDPPPATQPSLRSIPCSLRPAASDASSLDEPVSAGLKVHAKKLADDLQIPNKSLIEFIETGDLFLMLIDMKASLVKYELSNQTNQLQALQDTLSSKDFELGLHNCLLACLLSPNLTTYITDTQHHIMDFIFEHLDVFKIPAGVFDDAEIRSSLGRIVTRLLATIRSQLKSQLTMSIAKKTCIINVTKVLARSSSGMEVDAAHWNRLAFLASTLRTSDHKVAALDVCFTPRLIPNLKSDMRIKLERELGINISDMERALFKDDADVLARSSSGMEVDAAHWNRLAFLASTLRTGDHKVAALDVCFTPRLIPNLKSDMRIKLERELGINISDMERALFKDDADVDDTPATPEGNDSQEPLTQEPSIDPDLTGYTISTILMQYFVDLRAQYLHSSAKLSQNFSSPA
ncbi:hypothetical protein BDN67DRAFT_1013923 [Paxillus ammoniavirescens]|nr:hypothetical protein BDN67DRAFT_1013923 [Paxillus ammoniavirescens]